MISNTLQTNTFIGGMNTDTDVTMIGDNQYRYAENVRVITNDAGTTGVLQNIEGVKSYTSYIPTDETILGTSTINNIGIVITRLTSGINKVYRITKFDTNTPLIETILRGDLKLCQDVTLIPNLCIVSNYETDNNIKIYFTDGKSAIKVLNIVDNKYVGDATTNKLLDINGNILNPLAVDITPGALLPPFIIGDLTSGNLPSGVIQYCYQLFNLHGTESTLSSLSKMVHLTQSNNMGDSQDYEGTSPNFSSGKGCSLTVPLKSKDFEKCRIISIWYTQNNAAPTIRVVDEITVDPNQNNITYIDSGNSMLGEISIDEFNSLTGYQFIATTMTKMNNRLFVADITEETWNPGNYDARAYRANKNGIIKLNSANSSQNITINMDTADLTTVPFTHDCINPSNRMTLSQMNANSGTDKYIYGGYDKYGNRYVGGYGVNIQYNFTSTSLSLSTEQPDYRATDNCSMNVPFKIGINSMYVQDINMQEATYVPLPTQNVGRIDNYCDPYIASAYKGYQRDEIYRFGIIFYNKKNIPSPVYWIGDIRMPHASEPGFEPFVFVGRKLMANALGIKFTVRDFPKDATSCEIVRCDRTDSDRTVLMQCGMSIVGEYRIQENGGAVGTGTEVDSSIQTRPYAYLTYSGYDLWANAYNSIGAIGELTQAQVRQDYAKLISPEICVAGNDIMKYFKGNVYIDTLYAASSFIYNPELPTPSAGMVISSVFATPNKVLRSDGSEFSQTKLENQVTFNTQHDPLFFAMQYARQEPYSGYIAKYYYINSEVNGSKLKNVNLDIANAKYSGIIPYNGIMDVSPYTVNIGNITYTNFGMSNFNKPDNSGNKHNALGPSGPGIIANIPNLRSTIPGFKSVSFSGIYTYASDAANTIPIVNVKRNIVAYGGNTYVSRQSSVYISTNSYIDLTDGNTTPHKIITYGGDTYLNLLDYPTLMTFQGNEEDYWKNDKRFIGAYIPFESSINMNLFNGDMVHRTYRPGDNFIDTHLEVNITQKGNYHTQSKPYYLYNSTYSSQQGSRKFIPQTIYSENNLRTFNRILSSQAKTNNEILDNWTVFKIANYLDVDNQYGKVTNLYTFKDKLYYWQPMALGIAAVNERSLITDNNIGTLTLGTGDILSRFDYITSTNGSSITNDRSICNSNNSLYWYDIDKNEICQYNGNVIPLSKTKNLQTYLNELYGNQKNVTLGMYDKKYNEIWFRFNDKSLIFNEQLDVFTSFYTFNPDWAFIFSDKIVNVKNNKLYVLNGSDISGLGEVEKIAKIQFIVNKDVQYTKTFDNVRLSGDFLDKDNKHITINDIGTMKFSTKHETSGNYQNIIFDYREDTYRFPIPRGQNTQNELSYPARLRGKYLMCDYTFNSDDSHTFNIPYISTTYRYSLI